MSSHDDAGELLAEVRRLAGRSSAGQRRRPSRRRGARRLRDLPTPQGEHPYLDEILVTLKTAEAVLAALTVPGGDETFARRHPKP